MNPTPAFLKPHPEGVVVQLKVIPRSSLNQIAGVIEDRLKIRIAAPPLDSAANHELIKFLAKTVAVSKSAILLKRGKSSRTKTVLIRGLTLEEASPRLGH